MVSLWFSTNYVLLFRWGYQLKTGAPSCDVYDISMGFTKKFWVIHQNLGKST